MNVKRVLLVLILAALTVAGMTVAGDYGFARVIAEDASLCQNPSSRSAAVLAAEEGAFVRLTDKIANWYYAELPDQGGGWIHRKALEKRSEISSLQGLVLNEREVALYPETSLDSAPLGVFPEDAVVSLRQAKDGWNYVLFGAVGGYLPDGEFELLDAAALAPENSGALLPYTPPRVIDPKKPMIALTFDDGPSSVTMDIMRALEKNNAIGTFFMLGNRVERHANIVREVAEQGHEIGLHTWSHREMHRMSVDEIRLSMKKSVDVIRKTAGVTPTLLRPPYGTVTAGVRNVCREADIRIVNWSVDTEDWRSHNTNMIASRILRGARDGAIVLSHDLYGQTAKAMEIVIPELIARGYQLVTVSEMLEYRADGGQPGKLYMSVPAA